MHICHVILTDSFAGSERYAIDLANRQAVDHDVSIVLSKGATDDRPDALAHRLSPAVRQYHVDAWKLFRTRATAKLLGALPHVDVFHAHLSQACKSLSLQRLLKDNADAARIATLHIHYKKQQHGAMDGLIAIAPWQTSAIPGDRDFVQIDNWLSPTVKEANRQDREELRAQLGLSPETLLVGALGRVEHSKGHATLIDAWTALSPHPRQARLAIVGGGREWKKIRALASADVVMPGFSARPEKWMAAFDVFVSSALSEPFGLVFLEAMSAGLPIIASDSEGARHLSRLIRSSLLPAGDSNILKEALKSVIGNYPGRITYDLGEFDAKRKSDQIIEYYKYTLKKMAPRRSRQ